MEIYLYIEYLGSQDEKLGGLHQDHDHQFIEPSLDQGRGIVELVGLMVVEGQET